MLNQKMLDWLEFVRLCSVNETLFELIGKFSWEKCIEDEIIEVFRTNAKEIVLLGKKLGIK